MRYIGFIFDGGLIEFKMDFGEFIRSVYEACQSSNDVGDVCFQTIHFRDEHKNFREELFQPKSILVGMDETSNIVCNFELMCKLISINFLENYIGPGYPKFISIILTKKTSILLLKAIIEELRYKININQINNANGKIDNKINEKEKEAEVSALLCPLKNIFKDKKNNPIILTLAAKCLLLLHKNKEINLSYEGNLLGAIKSYLDEYYFDSNLIMYCLEIFSIIIVETSEENLLEILYSNYQNIGLVDILLKFLIKPKIPGVYYSQRLMIKVVTCLLILTTNHRAKAKEKFNSVDYIFIYSILINLIQKAKRSLILDPSEEESSILEYKIYNFLIILLAKNENAQNYVETNFEFKKIIEENSSHFLLQLKALINLNEKTKDTESRTIAKKVYKFLEFVYYFIVSNDDKKREIFLEYKNFMELKVFCDKNLSKLISAEKDMKSNVLGMLIELEKKMKRDML